MNAANSTPPSITLSQRDAARLEAMLEAPGLRNTPAAVSLLDELTRAEVVADHQVPADVVRMESVVECEDENGGERHVLTLVYPQDADVSAGKVSVLAPVGSALLGLSVGQSIDWAAPGGRQLRLKVTAVRSG